MSTEAVSIRLASSDDAPALLEIYAPFVSDTAVSFETQPPTPAEFARRISGVLAQFPWLVAETSQGQLLGYAYATPHREREAYQWCTEVSVYLAPQARGRGLGKRLYQELFALLQKQGYYNAYAGITLPNPASVGLHEALGFVSLGVFPRIGYKHGAWHDVGWWRLELAPHPDSPEPPKALPALRSAL